MPPEGLWKLIYAKILLYNPRFLAPLSFLVELLHLYKIIPAENIKSDLASRQSSERKIQAEAQRGPPDRWRNDYYELASQFQTKIKAL